MGTIFYFQATYKAPQIAFSRVLLLGAILCLAGCSKKEESRVESSSKLEDISVVVSMDSISLISNEGLVYHMDGPFSGTAISRHPSGNIATSTTYHKGKKNGVMKKFFQDGTPSYESYYAMGKLHGTSKTWWRNGNLRSEARYLEGRTQGLQQQWYFSGNKFKEQHMTDGKESGIQRSWRENGKLYNNYEAKDGRIFGLKRAALCFSLDNEEVQYAD